MNLDNCPRCGRLFVKNLMGLCSACIKELEHEYEICVNYLRENKGTNIQELSDATGISIKEITRFIREGRISIANAPNMMYPCEVCGTLIRDGHMCDSCRSRLRKDLTNAVKENSAEDTTKKTSDGAYRAIDKLRDL
ncbi:TIGR03826 family flagellar region protein [Paenibacillus sp. FSL R7-0048]|jgi:flagellar operon protein (TIGR03826 family)|uniref:Flagellar protein n=1 Tax=Paenibacillus odorifer TaxID=189426 RepID=A0ABX3GDY1_9BACL|nr:TIGR03826 family flagellar region protein [Paenibacillus odorifer]OMC77685.1 flagellar protein [Paenibacillus odorifer]OMC99718.1 flagellar protein [Paenibacillus odorifer]OMD74748.1 flagellar protein [Paenibacillus odorifer]OMD81761.1 flagellar protein [Paenibacillus odorifer]OMD83107.1 flagellar protein [Paenibacillus odorifer]